MNKKISNRFKEEMEKFGHENMWTYEMLGDFAVNLYLQDIWNDFDPDDPETWPDHGNYLVQYAAGHYEVRHWPKKATKEFAGNPYLWGNVRQYLAITDITPERGE